MSGPTQFFQLPISRKGNFFNDQFFEGFQTDYNSAMRDVMNRFSGRSRLADQFSAFRRLRQEKPLEVKEDEVAANVSENNDGCVIVLDLSDFVSGSVSVETKGRTAVVSASCGGKSLKKSFPLPRMANIDAVTVAMSDEGILTINAPKRKAMPQKSPSVPSSSPSPPSGQSVTNTSHISSNVSSSGRVIPLVVEADESPDANTPTPSTTIDDSSNTAAVVDEPHDDSADLDDSQLSNKSLKISKKGKFFEDAYFDELLQNFEKAMDDMEIKEKKSTIAPESNSVQDNSLCQSDSSSSVSSSGIRKFSRLNSYSNLRDWAPHDRTQAVQVSRDQKGYKVVMDIKSQIQNGELSVKAYGEDVVVCVEGAGGWCFKKTFTLPGLCNPEGIFAVVSEDGVLTITAPI